MDPSFSNIIRDILLLYFCKSIFQKPSPCAIVPSQNFPQGYFLTSEGNISLGLSTISVFVEQSFSHIMEGVWPLDTFDAICQRPLRFTHRSLQKCPRVAIFSTRFAAAHISHFRVALFKVLGNLTRDQLCRVVCLVCCL